VTDSETVRGNKEMGDGRKKKYMYRREKYLKGAKRYRYRYR
jgi:hypothetical protein